MDDSFQQYLLSKQSVDDRALNRHVLETLKSRLTGNPVRIVEAGAGIGTMLIRILRWNILEAPADYTLVELMPENIRFAHSWLPKWAEENGYTSVNLPDGGLLLEGPRTTVKAHFVQADVLEYVESRPPKSDLLITHAFLDLLPLPESLPKLISLIDPGGLAWFTINFDGMSTFEPILDPELDQTIVGSFHRTMDERITNGVHSGDSRTGRHLFAYLQDLGYTLLAAGSSDWVVAPLAGAYPDDERIFLDFILGFFESSLKDHPDLDPAELEKWLELRRKQVQCAELVYIAHQLDFLIRK
jgi:hypothetical protein